MAELPLHSPPTPALAQKTHPDVIPSIESNEFYSSFSYIKANGKLAFASTDSDISFNESAPDPIATEYRRIKMSLRESISTNKNLGSLDQPAYEQELSSLVHASIKGTVFDPKNYRQKAKNGTFTRDLNRLGTIDEYDCEHLTYIRGMLVHESDLHATAIGMRHKPTAFYAAPGASSAMNDDVEMLTGHIFIISASTGNIIEATSKNHGYQITKLSFEEFVAGYPAISHESNIYAASGTNVDTITAAKRLIEISDEEINTKKLASLKQAQKYTGQELPAATLDKLSSVLFALKDQIVEHCTQPITISTSSGSSITTEAGPLVTDPQLSNTCLSATKDGLGNMLIVTQSAKNVATQFVSASGKKLPVIAMNEEESVEKKIPLPTSGQNMSTQSSPTH